MRIFLIATVMLLLLTGGRVCAKSQSNANQQQTVSPPAHSDIKNKPSQNQYTTGKSPFPGDVKSVAGLGASDNKKEKENRFSDFFNVKVTDVCIALFTVIIGIYTWRLSDSTKKLWASTEESAKALPLIERAYIFASVRIEESLLVIDLKNHGKTPAILKSMYATRKLNTTPPQEIDSRPKAHIPDGIVIGADESWPAYSPPKITNGEWELIEGGEFTLFCYGVAEYMDVLNKKRTTGFCWQFNFESCHTRITN